MSAIVEVRFPLGLRLSGVLNDGSILESTIGRLKIEAMEGATMVTHDGPDRFPENLLSYPVETAQAIKVVAQEGKPWSCRIGLFEAIGVRVTQC